MTPQNKELLDFEGREVSIDSEPLSAYFVLMDIDPGFEAGGVELNRGYRGVWEIDEDRLYLVQLEANLIDGTKANLQSIFPESPDRVFADWYSGAIRIPDIYQAGKPDLAEDAMACIQELVLIKGVIKYRLNFPKREAGLSKADSKF